LLFHLRYAFSQPAASGSYSNSWRADDATRPFFHAFDAGFPVVSLLYYSIASLEGKLAFATSSETLEFQLRINSEVAPWWQGENACLASLATAARLATKQFVRHGSAQLDPRPQSL